jgi:hypothetical protein
MRTRLLSWLWLGLLLPLAAPAAADDQTRTDVLTAERDRKAAEVSAPRRSAVERALYWYDNTSLLSKASGGWHGFHLAGGDFPAGAGTKFGLGYTRGFGANDPVRRPDNPRRVTFNTFGAYSTKGYSRVAASVEARDLGNTPVDLRVLGQHYRFPQEDFFGPGSASSETSRTNYLLEATEVGADLTWKLASAVEVGGGLFHVSPRTGSGTDSRYPSSELVFDASALPGFDAAADFMRADARVAYDWRDNPLHPHSGGRYSIRFSDFTDQDLDAYSFRRVELDVQQYVPLPNQYRTIALRAGAVLTDAEAGQDVPFYYQPSLGGSQVLRGFREFRFQDRNSLFLTAEYRWEAWWALDGAFFVDAGTVAFDRKDLDLRAMDVSYGVGFRVHSNSSFVTRLDLAFSREGFVPLLRFEHVF